MTQPVDEFFIAPLEWLMELAEEQISGFGVMCQLLLIGIFAAAFHGSFLTPGTNPEAGSKVEQLVEEYQQDIKERNAWTEFRRMCDAATAEGRRFYEAELASLNRARAAEGKPELEEDPDAIEGHEVICPNCDESRRAASRRLVAAFRSAGIFTLQSGLEQRHKFVRPVPDKPQLEVERFDVGSCRSMTRVGAARMFIAHEAKDDAELVASVRDSLVMSQPLAYQATIIERMVYLTSRQLILGELRRELMESAPAAATLRSLLALVDRYAPCPSADLVIEGERLVTLDTIARTYTDDGNGDGIMIIAEIDRIGETPILTRVHSGDLQRTLQVLAWMLKAGTPRKRDSIAECNRIFDAASAWLKLSPHERAKSPSNPTKWNDELNEKRELVIGICMPNFARFAQTPDIHRIVLDGTRLMLAIELFKAESGEYPASLSDLAPAYLPAIPTDPFTGKHYIYRRLKPGEDPALDQQRPHLLYSTGFDAQDNSAKVHPEGFFFPADPDSKPGYDIVINQPR